MSEGCYLGVDGGGTKTEALVGDAQGRVLGRGLAGASNPYFVPRRSALAAVARAVRTARQQAEAPAIVRAALCVPALARHFDTATLAHTLALAVDGLLVEGDERSTFYGALGCEHGVVVLAGTGSFAMGISRAGDCLAIGGWGPLLGDEGSGYWIGLNALQAMVRAAEGRGPETVLTSLILAHYGLERAIDLRARIYGSHGGRKEIGALTPLVLQAAEAGDGVAATIIASAGRALAALAVTVVSRLGMDRPDEDLVLTGGVSNLGRWVWEPFRAAVRERCPAIGIRGPRFSPAVGALMLALRAGGVAWSDEVLANLDRRW